jgi:hypothetical protein
MSVVIVVNINQYIHCVHDNTWIILKKQTKGAHAIGPSRIFLFYYVQLGHSIHETIL